VKKAIKENPDAQVIVKPHPMTLDNPDIVSTLIELDCLILTQSIHLVDALETIDHVYTITSLGGFEALLRGKKVTVLGRPFYYKFTSSNLYYTNSKLSKRNRTNIFIICIARYSEFYLD